MSFDDNILLSFSPLPAHLCVLTWVAVAESQSQAYIFNAAAVYISFTDDALPSTAHLAFAADWNNYRGEKERGVRPTMGNSSGSGCTNNQFLLPLSFSNGLHHLPYHLYIATARN